MNVNVNYTKTQENCAQNIRWEDERDRDPKNLFLCVRNPNEPMKIEEWAAGVYCGRQKIHGVRQVEDTLKNYLHYVKDWAEFKKANPHAKSGYYHCMMVGVDHSGEPWLYRDVTHELNQQILSCMKKTKELANPKDMEKLKAAIKKASKVKPLAMLAPQFAADPEFDEIVDLAGQFDQIEPHVSTMKKYGELSRSINAQDWDRNFIATIAPDMADLLVNDNIETWMHHVSDGGDWDLKTNSTSPFSKPQQDIKMFSQYFFYRGYNSKTYQLENSLNFPRILRYDEPGNLIYGATGSVILSGQNDLVELMVLELSADGYAAGKDLDPQGSGMSKLIAGLSVMGELRSKEWLRRGSFLPIVPYDDPRDTAAVRWAYEAFALPDVQAALSGEQFIKAMRQRFKLWWPDLEISKKRG